jgi:tyrosinase
MKSETLLLLVSITCIFQQKMWVSSQTRPWHDRGNLLFGGGGGGGDATDETPEAEGTEEPTEMMTEMRIESENTEEPTEMITDMTTEPPATNEPTEMMTMREPAARQTEQPTQEPTEAAVTDAPRRGTCGDDVRRRKPWRDLSCQEQDEFLQAIYRLKDQGIYDDFVRTHQWESEDTHGTALFLPWHRWFIYEFESALQTVADDPCITLPYWDWEQDAGREMRSIIFDDTAFGFFSDRNSHWRTARGNRLRREWRNREFWRPGQILGMVANYEQYTDDWENSSDRNNGFRAALEGGPHAAPHNLVGGEMVSMWSPDDPLFFVHHANVDRIWALWQDYVDHDMLDPSEYSAPIHYEGRGIDRPMPFPPTRFIEWDFRLGDDFPTPRDVLSNDAIVRVRYIDDQLARILRYTPNPNWFEQASSSEMREACERNRRNERDLKSRVNHLNGHRGGTVEKMFEGTSLRRGISFNPLLKNLKNEVPQNGQHVEIDIPDMSFSEDERATTSSITDCLAMNTFTNNEERLLWDDLCHDLPATTTYAERLAALAQQECRNRDNPYSASTSWIKRMNMRNELVTFECFHLPDRKNE